MNQYQETLINAKQKVNMMIVYRDEIGASYYAGIPVNVSSEICVLQKEDGFRLDGYVALRLGDINYIEQYDDNAFCKKALEGEKVYQTKKDLTMKANTWNELLNGILSEYDGWCSLESETSEETVYFIGKLTKVENGFAFMKRIDADGTWHKEESSLPLDELTLVTFGDNYLEVFRKYSK